MVRLASRMFSAISLGVFCRAAPSTRLIIRSMKLSPGLAVICTTMRSESTLVPPVTELRSPPDSRMTGADSPVIADSSTLATPSTTSPSPGMVWPASTTTRSPSVSWGAGTSRSVPSSSSRRATVSVLARRKDAAWAFPRPSATASARFAKRTVSHSQTTTDHAKKLDSLNASTVDSTAPTSTTSMTGLWTITRGSSLRTASGSEVTSILGSSRPPCTRVVDITDLPPEARGPAPGRTSVRRR